jgi:hypothetical protein
VPLVPNDALREVQSAFLEKRRVFAPVGVAVLVRPSLGAGDIQQAEVSTLGISPTIYWLLTGHLNSMQLVLGKSGDVLEQIAYDAFGNIVVQLNRQLVNLILFA